MKKNKRRVEWGLLLVLVSLSVFAGQGDLKTAPLSLTFTHGIASGDITPFSAVLWTRVDQEVKLKVEVALDPAFQEKVFKRTILASANNDFTAQVTARWLRS